VFEVAWYADDVEHSKPHPEALLRALEELAVEPRDTVYVGDTTVDLEMARRAGAAFAAVGTTTPEAAFAAAGVDRVWPGVGDWASDLLGRPARRRGSSGTHAARRPSVRSGA
jgi:phosphoglycolate phosphatase-like HAD superfamily hydrolase